MPKKEVYHSSTMGDIPLSFTGRHLLQSLREATTEMVADIKAGANLDAANWEPVSRARARLAKYMSQLEEKNPDLVEVDMAAVRARIENERRRRGAEARIGWNEYVATVPPNGRPMRISALNMDAALDKAMLWLKHQGLGDVERRNVFIRLDKEFVLRPQPDPNQEIGSEFAVSGVGVTELRELIKRARKLITRKDAHRDGYAPMTTTKELDEFHEEREALLEFLETIARQ